MKFSKTLCVSVAAILATMLAPLLGSQSGDRSGWRGPSGNGHASPGQTPPIEWSESDQVAWSAAVPGRGHSSPIMVDDRLFLTTAREATQEQSVLCYSVTSGALLWETVVLEAQLPEGIHHNNTHASPTVATDGERVFALFYTENKSLNLFALDMDGNELWQVDAGTFDSEYTFGYGSSPVVAEEFVIVSNDSQGTGYLIAYNLDDGTEAWRTPRLSEKSSFGTLALGEVDGRIQLLTSGHGQRVAGFDPQSGQELWSVPGGPPVVASTVVWDDRMVYASGGFPSRETWATDVVSGQVLWMSPAKCYEQSMILVDDSLYGVSEGGLMYCWNAKSGEIRWRERLPKGPESASLVYAGGHLYHANEEGAIFVIKPNPERLELIAENQLGDEIFATPAVRDNRLYYRVASYDDNHVRTETLYAIGQ